MNRNTKIGDIILLFCIIWWFRNTFLPLWKLVLEVRRSLINSRTNLSTTWSPSKRCPTWSSFRDPKKRWSQAKSENVPEEFSSFLEFSLCLGCCVVSSFVLSKKRTSAGETTSLPSISKFRFFQKVTVMGNAHGNEFDV